jgi:hypothetical protein
VIYRSIHAAFCQTTLFSESGRGLVGRINGHFAAPQYSTQKEFKLGYLTVKFKSGKARNENLKKIVDRLGVRRNQE